MPPPLAWGRKWAVVERFFGRPRAALEAKLRRVLLDVLAARMMVNQDSRKRVRVITRTHLLLMLGAFVVSASGAVWWLREPMAPLTRESLAAARQRWRAAAIGEYEMAYRMLGSEYVVRTRKGIVESVTVNGQMPTSGNWRVYGVEGLLDTLEQELDNVADPAGPFAGGKPPMLRVRFNSELGYVERYLRSASGSGKGALLQVSRFVRH